MATTQENFGKWELILRQDGAEKANLFLLGLPYLEYRDLAERIVWEKSGTVFQALEKAIIGWATMAGKNG